ncbi:hypothetical protein ACC846_37900, partial [Rhizobium ruizarguesonis]
AVATAMISENGCSLYSVPKETLFDHFERSGCPSTCGAGSGFAASATLSQIKRRSRICLRAADVFGGHRQIGQFNVIRHVCEVSSASI